MTASDPEQPTGRYLWECDLHSVTFGHASPACPSKQMFGVGPGKFGAPDFQTPAGALGLYSVSANQSSIGGPIGGAAWQPPTLLLPGDSLVGTTRFTTLPCNIFPSGNGIASQSLSGRWPAP